MFVLGICDDEDTARTRLIHLLEVYAFQHNVDFDYIEIEDTFQLPRFQYDILFLDVRFNDVEMGVDAAITLRNLGYTGLIIFLTSYADYSIVGYKAEAFRYLVKPISDNQLTEVMDAAIAKLTSPKEALHIQVERGIVAIPLDELILIESTARQRRIVSVRDELYTWETLQELYARLPQDAFAYPQRSFIVHFKYVSQVRNMVLRLRNGTEISIGRKYRAPLMERFNQYIDAHN